MFSKITKGIHLQAKRHLGTGCNLGQASLSPRGLACIKVQFWAPYLQACYSRAYQNQADSDS